MTAPRGASAAAAALFRAAGARLGPGSQGPLVAALQRALGLGADGDFGSLTGAAVSAFRASHGLPAGQVVDPATWRTLLAVAADGAIPVGPAPSPSPSPSPSTPPGTSGGTTAGPLAPYTRLVLHYGDRGPAVLAVQKLLHVSATGWFGPLTQGAVRTFQRTHAVPVTGNVGPLTWAQLTRLAAGAR